MLSSGFAKSLSTPLEISMNGDADAGPRLRQDRWGVGALRRLPKRRVCQTEPFVPECRYQQASQ